MKKRHSKEYIAYIRSTQWRKKSEWVRSLTRPFWLKSTARGRCCLFLWLIAKETHHLTYRCKFGSELPVLDLIPLSKYAHKIVHFPLFWIYPFRFLINSYLRFSFLFLWTISRPFWAIPLWIALFYPTKNWLWPWGRLIVDDLYSSIPLYLFK